MPRLRCAWWLTALTALALLACEKKAQRSGASSECSRNRRCPAPHICVLRPGGTAGRCVPPCAKDGDCPRDQRCTGGYTPDGTQAPQRYCKRSTVPAGGDCSGLLDGCQTGYECRHGKTCIRTCQGDDDCSAEERCVGVTRRRVFGKPTRADYRVCAKATLKRDATCAPDRRPLCARGWFCRRQKCVQECADDPACGDGFKCDGVFQRGTAVGGDLPPPRRYCRRAAGPGERCGRNPVRDVGCVDDHTCYRGRCRRLCEASTDCADVPGRKTRCRKRRRRGTTFRICL